MRTLFTPLAITALLCTAATGAVAQDKVRWGVPMSFGSNLTALGDTMPWVSEQLKKASGGNIDLKVFRPVVGTCGVRLGQSGQGRGRLQLHGLRARQGAGLGAVRCHAVRDGVADVRRLDLLRRQRCAPEGDL